MAPSGLVFLTSFLTISATLAAPHNKLHHHRKHPMHHKNATALGVTGTGTGGYVMPLSTGIVIDNSAPALTVTVSPIPEFSGTGAMSPATGAAAVGPGTPAAAAPQTVSPDEAAPAPSEAAPAPSESDPGPSEAASDLCDTDTETVTITSTATDYVTVTAGPDDASADTTAAATSSVPYGMGNSTAAPAMTGIASISLVAPVSMSSTVDPTSSSSGSGFDETSSTLSSAVASSSTSSSTPSPAEKPIATTAVPVISTATPAASSTSAAPSLTPSTSRSISTTSGAKRGLSFNDPSLTNAFSQSSKIAWTYNWGQSPTGTIPSSFEYVPMLWGTEDEFTSPWAAAASSAIKSGSKHLLSFNEPDLDTQSNISPSDAAAGHQQHMNPFSGQALIGSPAVTNGGGDSGLAWLQSFFDACAGGCKVDFINIHWYDSATNIPYFKSHIADAITLAQKNGVSKVWLTEFQGSGSADQQAAMLDEVMPYMDGLEALDRYAWFMCADQNLVDGTAMSSLGTTYAS